VTLYKEFNKFQFGTVINGIKTLAKCMLPNVSDEHIFLIFIKSICMAIWSSDALILEKFICN